MFIVLLKFIIKKDNELTKRVFHVKILGIRSLR